MNHNAIMISGKGADIKYGITKHLEEKPLDVALFHYVRSQEIFISYEAIESVKDGIFFSAKYESGMCLFNSPHVLVFANFMPDITKLSKDRWQVFEIVDNTLKLRDLVQEAEDYHDEIIRNLDEQVFD